MSVEKELFANAIDQAVKNNDTEADMHLKQAIGQRIKSIVSKFRKDVKADEDASTKE